MSCCLWSFLADSLLSHEDLCMLQGSAYFHIIYLGIVQNVPGLQSCMSLKIISSSALFIFLLHAFLFMWKLWFWELLCVLFFLLSVRFGVGKY